jgi:hypothetical protein
LFFPRTYCEGIFNIFYVCLFFLDHSIGISYAREKIQHSFRTFDIQLVCLLTLLVLLQLIFFISNLFCPEFLTKKSNSNHFLIAYFGEVYVFT